MRKSLIYILSPVIFISCLKNYDNIPTIYTEPPIWSFQAEWQEFSRTSEGENAQLITNGQPLQLWWEELKEDEEVVRYEGAYRYMNPLFDIIIDTSGKFIMKDGLMTIVNYTTQTADTVAVFKYWYVGNLLYVKDTTVNPAIQYIYQRKN